MYDLHNPAATQIRPTRFVIPSNNADQPLSTYNPNDPNSSNDTPGAPPGRGLPGWSVFLAGGGSAIGGGGGRAQWRAALG